MYAPYKDKQKRANEVARVMKTTWSSILQDVLSSLGIFVVALFVYQSNGDTYLYAYDSAPNTLLTFNAIDNHRLDFENFRNGYFDSLGAHYIFIKARDGKLASLFPVGAAILTAPLFAAFDVERRLLRQPLDITQPEFERYRLHYEKTAANSIAALAAVLMCMCARRMRATLVAAMTVTAFFAFGTEMWVVGSQALWQHGSVNLVVLAMIYSILAAIDARNDATTLRWLLLAGICAGFLPVVRPTAVLFLIAASVYIAVLYRLRSWTFGCGILIGLAPGIVWNSYFFSTVIGGYVGNTNNYVPSLVFAQTAPAGLLVSPSKGLAITTPLIIFSIAGAIRAGRSGTPSGRLMGSLAIAALALVGTYAFYIDWWGGTNFGDRFLTDIAGISALLLLYVFPRKPVAFARSGVRPLLASALFVVLFVLSVGVQFVGANGEMESEWSAVPNNVDDHTQRLWKWSDTQIQRDARATYRKFAKNRTLESRYMRGLDARVTAIRLSALQANGVLTGRTGQPLELIADIRNSGASPLYGYKSGFWIGQARVRVQIRNAAGAMVSSANLYLPDVCASKAQAVAIGTVATPALPGTYEMRADISINRIDDLLAPPRKSLIIPFRAR